MDKSDIIALAEEFIRKNDVGYLATVNNSGKPFIRAIQNIRSDPIYPKASRVINKYDTNTLTIYFTTNVSSKKYKQIRVNSQAAIYFCNPDIFSGLMFQGKIEEVNELQLKEELWEDVWFEHHPDGFKDPDFAILKLIPDYLEGWHKNKVISLDIKSTNK